MNETTESTFPTSATNGSSGASSEGTVRRVAQKAHETVDKLEQSLGSGTEKVMSWQQEYGQMARDRITDKPLTAIATAFAVGVVFSKLFMR